MHTRTHIGTPICVGFFLATVILCTNAGNGLGIFIAHRDTDMHGLVAAPPLILPLMIFSGFFINSDSMPVWLMWLRYLSPMYYAFQVHA